MHDSELTYPRAVEGRLFKWALILSVAGHLMLIGGILFTPQLRSGPSLLPAIIDVRMVDVREIPDAGDSSPKTAKTQADAPKTKQESKPEPVQKNTPEVQAKEAAKAEISIAKQEPKAKVSLKYQTIKPKQVIQKALERIEERVEAAPPRPLEETIKRLREKVEKDEKSGGGPAQEIPAGAKGAKTGFFTKGSKQEAELIDIYQVEIAHEIQKHWAYAEQLAGGGAQIFATIYVKVLSDGHIAEINFLERSGNDYLDDSAYKAIVKSSPVKPHPEGLSMDYIILGLRFTPEGINY